jgi:folate-binding protein YgfZ
MSTLRFKAVELLATVAVYRTRDRVVHVRGDDARSWLNGQISNDVRELHGDDARYALTLTVKGRIVSDLWALDEPPGMALVLPEARCQATLERLEKHIIMEDVELAPDPEIEVLTVQGARASELVARGGAFSRTYPCPRLGPGGIDLWVPRAEADAALAALREAARTLGGGTLDEANWAEAHVALGIPRLGVDFGEDSYPQEAGLGPRALSFSKGCYLGQEVVYMLENRGQLPRRLVQLEAPASVVVEPGMPILDGEGKRVGEVTSTTTSGDEVLALGYVKRALAEAERFVWVGGSPCRVRGIAGEA